ncbi:hypothetical protein [Methylosinus sp. PW1]|uniref:hypothetical protein n=1 Tax=Methylosinus sp. PW1 TaxID=107636 RepID=UPI0012EBD483|nr:hypothetical protein [Methylosinus sp. PW1]
MFFVPGMIGVAMTIASGPMALIATLKSRHADAPHGGLDHGGLADREAGRDRKHHDGREAIRTTNIEVIALVRRLLGLGGAIDIPDGQIAHVEHAESHGEAGEAPSSSPITVAAEPVHVADCAPPLQLLPLIGKTALITSAAQS